MLTFAVVVSRTRAPVRGPVVEALRDPGPTGVPFEAAAHVVWSDAQETVWFAGWHDVLEPVAQQHGCHADEDTLTAFTGRLWPRGHGWSGSESIVEQLARRWQERSPSTDDLDGCFVATSLERNGRGWVVSDPLGFGLVHRADARDVVVVSTRAALAAELSARADRCTVKRDVVGAGWLAFATRAVGRATGFAGVQVVPAGASVEIGPDGGPRVVRPDRVPWRSHGSSDPPVQELLERARTEMTTAVRTALDLSDASRRAGLTGGKDSRLVLALLLAEGWAQDFEFETLGSPDLPDVRIASEIASDFGLRHVVNPSMAANVAARQQIDAMIRADRDPEASSREIGLRMTVWACSGARNVVHPVQAWRARAAPLLLSGFAGETLRASWPSASRFRSKADAATFPEVDLKFGSLDIVRPEARAYYREELHRQLFDDSRVTDSPQDVIDAFYMRHWIRRWFGAQHEFDPQNLVVPLYSSSALRLAFVIGGENRHAAWIHHHLMDEACAALAGYPFASGGWPEGAGGPLRAVARHDEPAPPEPPAIQAPRARPGPRTAGAEPVRTVVGERRVAVEHVDHQLLERFLCEDRENPVFEVLEPRAVGEAVERFRSLPEREKVQLYGALTAAIWLGGHEIPVPTGAGAPPSRS